MEKGAEVRKVYDVDLGDQFWEKNASSPFPQMTEEVNLELNRYKKDAEEISRSCGVSNVDEIGANMYVWSASWSGTHFAGISPRVPSTSRAPLQHYLG